jgi:hypothetical protein
MRAQDSATETDSPSSKSFSSNMWGNSSDLLTDPQDKILYSQLEAFSRSRYLSVTTLRQIVLTLSHRTLKLRDLSRDQKNSLILLATGILRFFDYPFNILTTRIFLYIYNQGISTEGSFQPNEVLCLYF